MLITLMTGRTLKYLKKKSHANASRICKLKVHPWSYLTPSQHALWFFICLKVKTASKWRGGANKGVALLWVRDGLIQHTHSGLMGFVIQQAAVQQEKQLPGPMDLSWKSKLLNSHVVWKDNSTPVVWKNRKWRWTFFRKDKGTSAFNFAKFYFWLMFVVTKHVSQGKGNRKVGSRG